MVLSKSNIHRPSDCWSRNLCIVAVVDNYFPVPMLCSLLGPVTLQHSSLAVWRADTSSTVPPHSARCGDKSYVWNIVHRIKNSGLRAVIYIVFILKGGYTPNIKYTSFAVPLGGWGEHELANVFVLDLFWPCKAWVSAAKAEQYSTTSINVLHSVAVEADLASTGGGCRDA